MASNNAISTNTDGSIDLGSILGAFKPAGGGTSTTTSTVSQATANAYMNNILQGSSGLAAVAGGQHSAGGYNSTTTQLLTDNLIAQTAAQTAALSKNQTTTTSPTPQLKLGSTLAGMAGVMGHKA